MKPVRTVVGSAVVLIAVSTLIGTLVSAHAAEKPAVATATDPVTHEENERVPEGAAWTQHYFPSSDRSGVELHADVLLPENLPLGKKVPVILSVGPYFGHAGETSPEDHEHTGPSARFSDLIEGGRLLERGYALVMVDLRGYGGSTGCFDWNGPGEQADVRAAIDWAAGRPWSSGAVGMYGKSYDAITGLIGNALDQPALKAVVAQEPAWNPYHAAHTNDIPRLNSLLLQGSYPAIAQMPPMPDDDARYKANAVYEATHPQCADSYTAGLLVNEQDSAHWRARDLPRLARGSDTPLFLTQGFIEDNTKPEDLQRYLAGHRGPKRAWLGQWDHVRGNDRDESGRLKMGRDGWFDEVMSFYDQYLKGIAPATTYPAFAIQDSTGEWRAQDRWPGAVETARIDLGGGTYVDDGGADAYTALVEAGHPVPPPPVPVPGEGGDGGAGALEPTIPKQLAAVQLKRIQQGRPTSAYYKFSAPVARATRLVGTPEITVAARGRGNIMVKLYDVAPGGTAVIINENVAVLDPARTRFELKSTDWTLAPGHVLGVEIGAVQTGSWYDLPSGEMIKVGDARLTLPLGNPARDETIQGGPAPFTATYRERHQVNVTAVGRPSFTVPSLR
ncbi:CocE/NonD family hydrolase [Micromonospora sp. WMMD1155]|uniref:CocE/NonD family hydrolase n=1 Tax=Micromonospora sp. WMMD1155 TaxID=3016094 RepID=UPI002499C740|nr:CocE/NonD family hydrolase [Micromonospora sp. WMMD1155]WFE53264.1 CocE/NonD family hydrolase [Micromonospora sp. WMMD1155]